MNPTTTTVGIDAAHAVEIAEALHWLSDWLTSDPLLESSIGRFSSGLTSLEETTAAASPVRCLARMATMTTTTDIALTEIDRLTRRLRMP